MGYRGSACLRRASRTMRSHSWVKEMPAAAAAVDHVDATKTHAIISSASESEGPSVSSRLFSRATRQHNFDRVQPSMNIN